MFAEAIKSQNGPILITGHTGFKGTWLSLLLDYLTIEHYGFALEPESGSLFDRLELRNLFPGIIGDIRNLDTLISSFSKIKPAIVVHMAAQPLVLKAYKEPLETFEVNVLGTANVIKTAFATPSVKIVLVITTDKVYKNDDSGRRFREGDSLSGKDPYSASKVGAEAVCAAWQQISRTYGGPKVIVARAGNVIGGGDFAADRIIPDIIRGVISNKPTLVRNPNSKRPWQHVLDPILGYLLFIESTLREETKVDALNFGPSERSLEVRRILDIGQEILGNRIKYIFSEETSNREAATLELDSTLANQELLWLPKWSQEEALKRTFTWWKSVIEGQKSAYNNCIHDIEEVLAQGN